MIPDITITGTYIHMHPYNIPTYAQTCIYTWTPHTHANTHTNGKDKTRGKRIKSIVIKRKKTVLHSETLAIRTYVCYKAETYLAEPLSFCLSRHSEGQLLAMASVFHPASHANRARLWVWF